MKILAISDLHGAVDVLERVVGQHPQVDVVVLPGDITHFGPIQTVERIAEVFRRRGLPWLAVAGNCDPHEVDEELNRLGVGLNGVARSVGGAFFHGVSATPPWQAHMFHYTEEEIWRALHAGHEASGPANWRVLVCHVPPYQSKVDRMYLGRHCGSSSVREFILKHRPHLVLCGHIHEARGTDTLGDTTIVNCGHGARGYYALVELRSAQPPEVILGHSR